MNFKDDSLRAEFNQCPSKLKKIAMDFAYLSEQMGIEAMITRIFERIPGDSGVHEAHRAIDFRDEFETGSGRKCLYNGDDVNFLVTEMNKKYPRSDGKMTCIHHSFQGGPYHFHLQIAPNQIDS